MDILLLPYSTIAHCFRVEHNTLVVADFKKRFDDIISYLNKIPGNKRKTNGMYILTAICDDLASFHTFRLFDHLILRNHPIFDYIGRTFEMLLTKSNRSQTILMTKEEDDCFSSMSYFIAQLCLYQNEPSGLIYGDILNEIFPVTEKPNAKGVHILQFNRDPDDEIIDTLNLKTARLKPDAPAARPLEKTKFDVTKIPKLKKFPHQFMSKTHETQIDSPIIQSNQIELPAKLFQNIFLTKLFFYQLARAINDLSQYEYSSYHVKYKVIDRLVRLCSKLNMIDELIDPIIKCLCSKYYRDAFITIEINQIRLNPKQLFFIYECTQFLVQHNFLDQGKIVGILCKSIIEATKTIFDKHFSAIDTDIDSNQDGDRRIIMLALSCHIELLYQFSSTSFGRKYFLQSSIIDQFLSILRQSELTASACEHQHLFNANVGIVAYSLMLLYNLAFETEIFSILKQSDLQSICLKLKSANDHTIKFASMTLATILKEDKIDEDNEPSRLKEGYIQFLEDIIVESEQITKTDVTRNTREKDNKKGVFLRGSFLEKLIFDIDHLSKHGYPSNEQRYKNTAQQIRVCSTEETDDVESLLGPIIACLSSKFYRDVYTTIDVNHVKISNSNLAPKQLFFMRDCVEFLIRHDYKRQDEIASILCPNMLENAGLIFDQHLPILTENEDDEETKNARIEALLYHIKLLSHLALAQSTRKDFLTHAIIDKLLRFLGNKMLIDNAHPIVNVKVVIVAQSLTLLYNLAFTKEILVIMKNKDVLGICLQWRLSKDKIIHFVSQALMILLDSNKIDEIIDPRSFTKFCIECMKKSAKEPRQAYQGIKLSGLLRILGAVLDNDTVQKTIIEGKEGISSLAKCACVVNPDNTTADLIKKIRRSSLNIIWKLLSLEPTLSNKLKINDLFIEHIRKLSEEASGNEKKMPSRIIWKLGDEEAFHSEEDTDDIHGTTTIDDEINSNDAWDDSIPFDVIMSFSHDSNDKNLCQKIYNRLKLKDVQVYFELQGKHRLESIKQASLKKKIILVCLSAAYRSSKFCMAELECASKQECPIIPVIVGLNYKVKGWLSHLVGKKDTIDFTQKNFKDALLKLTDQIEKMKPTE
ncbi:unnamed protein product [Rotaria socialis]|uniref:TIR domain-containing protein n=1 Tax=Rotaria socialis TaxID=392032 RepID=A0A817PIR9_9BILA|nr:unnamed protein product [Rotaria socialis]CAF4287068.1 unnamed protein product [Rotaria socialis]